MATRRAFGNIVLQSEVDALSYRLEKTYRGLQLAAGGAFVLVAGGGAAVFLFLKPMSTLVPDAGEIDRLIGGILAVLTIALVVALPVFRSSSIRSFVFRRSPNRLHHGLRTRDLAAYQKVVLEYRGGTTGELSGPPRWLVTLMGNGRAFHLPYLEFPQREEAKKVAAEIASFLNLDPSL